MLSSFVIVVNFKEIRISLKEIVVEKGNVSFGWKVTVAETGRLHLAEKRIAPKVHWSSHVPMSNVLSYWYRAICEMFTTLLFW